MAIESTRTTAIDFTGGVIFGQTLAAGANSNSPGMSELRTLLSGFNSITVPTSGTVPTAVTIIPPSGNTTSIILKGVSGDTGIRLHNTDPTTIAINSTVVTIGLTAGASISGVRFIWS